MSDLGTTPASPFEVEPWVVRERGLHIDMLARTESVFALSNGHVGLRGNLDEGEPHGLPGTYLNSVYEKRPLPYAEAGYSYPESGQTVIDVTNGKIIRLLVDDEPFDVRYGALLQHDRTLDMRAGTLCREVRWRSPAERVVDVKTTRLVSLTHRSVAAICYEVTAVDAPTRVVLQSELVANEDLPSASGDPRVSAVLKAPLEPIEHDVAGMRIQLLHRTRNSGIGVAAAADHVVEVPDGVSLRTASEARPDWGRVTVSAVLQPGQTLRLVKFISYGWSALRSTPALRDQAPAGLTGAMLTGWDGLLADQRAYLDEFWDGADVEVEGDDELQQAVRFALFHVLQAGARAEERPIAAKGLTGPGYDGHCFWDTETFVLPVLVHTWPSAAADALRWRHGTLDAARRAGRASWDCPGRRSRGARSTARSARATGRRGRRRSTSTPTSRTRSSGTTTPSTTRPSTRGLRARAARRDGAAVALARAPRHLRPLADRRGDRPGRVQRGGGQQRLHEPDGPAEPPGRRRTPRRGSPTCAETLEVTEEEMAAWRDAARDAVYLPYDEVLGVHEQSEGFTRHASWDFERDGGEATTRCCCTTPTSTSTGAGRQAGRPRARACRCAATRSRPSRRRANFAYYEAFTVRDSSLSACTQAVIAAEVGCLDLAYDYVGGGRVHGPARP